MREILMESAYFGMFLSLFCYQLALLIKRKVKIAIANPLLVTVLIIIAFLLLFDIEYEIYYEGAKYISYFLTPATVSLAIPLYRQLTYLKKYPKAILLGVFAGVMTAMISILLMSIAFGLTHVQYVTILPKSITLAIAMGISEKIGGISTIMVVAISITGILGNVAAEWMCKLFRIQEPMAKGIAIGTSAHALGTTKALEMGEVEGAMSSLSIVVAGIMTVLTVFIFEGML